MITITVENTDGDLCMVTVNSNDLSPNQLTCKLEDWLSDTFEYCEQCDQFVDQEEWDSMNDCCLTCSNGPVCES